MYSQRTDVPLALVRAFQHWEQRARQYATDASAESPPAPAFTIALSREVGARGTTLARAVGQRLDWPVYDHELVEQIAKEMKLRVSLVESVDERRTSWLQECLEAFGSMATVSESAYVRHLVKTLLALAAHGDCVIVGRGAAQVLPPQSTLRVRLVGERQDRVRVMSRELKVSEDEAESRIDAADRQRNRFVQDHFHKDPSDPRQYDLVLNTSRFSDSDCADFIVTALHRLRSQTVREPHPVEPAAPPLGP